MPAPSVPAAVAVQGAETLREPVDDAIGDHCTLFRPVDEPAEEEGAEFVGGGGHRATPFGGDVVHCAGTVNRVCFDHDSLPPIPAISGAAVAHEDLVLEAADGTASRRSRRSRMSRTGGVVILPDVRGLYRFYEELALRFAERGIAAVAIDYFGRTAGVEEARRRVRVHGARRADDRRGGPGRRRCRGRHLRRRGARPSSRSASASAGATRGSRPRAATSSPARSASTDGRAPRDGDPGPSSGRPRSRADPRAHGRRRPGDHRGRRRRVRARARAEAGVEHEVVTYDGAPHSFFDRKQEEFADASADAWRRVLAFFDARR